MRKIEFLKPLFIHILISIISIFIFTIIDEKLMVDVLTFKIVFTIETFVVVLLYILLSNVFLKKLPLKTLLTSIAIILTINLILGLSGYIMTNYFTGISIGNGELPLVLLVYFNNGFFPLSMLLKSPELPEIVIIIMFIFMGPICLYIGNRKLTIFKK